MKHLSVSVLILFALAFSSCQKEAVKPEPVRLGAFVLGTDSLTIDHVVESASPNSYSVTAVGRRGQDAVSISFGMRSRPVAGQTMVVGQNCSTVLLSVQPADSSAGELLYFGTRTNSIGVTVTRGRIAYQFNNLLEVTEEGHPTAHMARLLTGRIQTP